MRVVGPSHCDGKEDCSEVGRKVPGVVRGVPGVARVMPEGWNWKVASTRLGGLAGVVRAWQRRVHTRLEAKQRRRKSSKTVVGRMTLNVPPGISNWDTASMRTGKGNVGVWRACERRASGGSKVSSKKGGLQRMAEKGES